MTNVIHLSRKIHNNISNVLYIGHVGNVNIFCPQKQVFSTVKMFKYGITNNIYRRVQYSHKRNFDKFDLVFFVQSNNSRQLESIVKRELVERKNSIRMPIKDTLCRELFFVKDNFEFDSIVDFILNVNAEI